MKVFKSIFSSTAHYFRTIHRRLPFGPDFKFQSIEMLIIWIAAGALFDVVNKAKERNNANKMQMTRDT